jgi:electron transport complex protein RnfB
MQSESLIDAIELLLPQTQCGQCGHSGCAPYAQAIVTGAAINRCPPGGDRTIERLAKLLHKPVLPLDPEYGQISPPTVVAIREIQCIGCTKCIQACPVDAIVGAAKLMHTVIQSECTGCNLCIAPCPVDCIDILPAPRQQQVSVKVSGHAPANPGAGRRQEERLHAYRKKRFESRRQRLARDTLQRRGSRRRSVARPENPEIPDAGLVGFSREQAKVEIADAVARVKARREKSGEAMQPQTGTGKE